MKKLIKLFLVSILVLFSTCIFCEEYKSNIDYMQKTKRLWGIASCIVNSDGSVTFIDSKNEGVGYALWIPDRKGGFFDKVILNKSESFDLIDGDHAFINYKFLRLDNGNPVIEVIDRFDATSFGDGIKEEKAQVIIKQY